MNFDSIDFNLILLSFMWLIAGIIATWVYMKKTMLYQSLENQTAQKSLKDLLQKNEELLIEKIDLDKQLAVLKQEAGRLPEIKEELKIQQKKYSEIQILKATLEERLDSKENESREKLKFLEEAKKLMGTEFENLSAKIFDTKSKQFTEANKNNIQNLLTPIQTKLKEFQEKVEKFHLEDETGRASIKAEFEHFKEVSSNLSQDAQNLTTALREILSSKGVGEN